MPGDENGIAPNFAPDYNNIMNWNLIGHDWAVDMLSSQIAAGVLRHAYLFTGPKGIGRRTLALKFAQAINCPEAPAPGEACGACRTCRQIADMAHADLAVVQAEVEGETLVVDQIRELQHSLALAPYAAAYRIALLLRFEEASDNAANALLKTLEEPSPRVVLLLTADSPENLPETILSRCQLIRLRPMPIESLAARMQQDWHAAADTAHVLAHLAGGRPGLAKRLLNDPDSLSQRTDWLDEHHELLPSNRVQRFNYADQMARVAPKDPKETRRIIKAMLETWSSYWRDIMILCAGSATPLTNIDRLQEMQDVSGRVDIQIAHKTLCAIEETLDRIDQYANVRLAAETLMLSLPRL